MERSTVELSHFIWSELERFELASPVYDGAGLGGYEAMCLCLDMAEDLLPTVWDGPQPCTFILCDWTFILYERCSEVAQAMHAYMLKYKEVPTWADLGEFL